MARGEARVFVGRARELGRLRAAAKAAAADRPAVVVVSGPSGIGKTALVERFAAELDGHRDGVREEGEGSARPDSEAGGRFVVLGAEGSALEAGLPFSAADRLLRRAAAVAAHRDRPAGTAPAAGRDRGGPPGTGREPGGPGRSELVVAGELVEALDRAQAAAPVLLWLEDAHLFDQASLHACGLALLRTRGEGDRVLTVVTTDRPARTAADMGLAGLGAEAEHVELGGLSVAEARAYLRLRLGRTPSESRVRTLVRWSQGSPLYLEAALGALPRGLPDDPRALRVPASLGEVVGEWARTFDPAGRAVLDTLAVLDAPAPLPLLARLLGSDSVAADAEPLVQRGAVVWADEGGVARLRLSHAAQRQALYAAIPPADRARTHRRVAELLEPPASWHHRVAGAEAYDAGLAAGLRTAARQEEEAGQSALAAEYGLAAAQIDPDDRGRREALLRAVRLLVVGGRYGAALEHREAVARTAPGPLRARVLGLLDFADGRDAAALVRLRKARDGYVRAGAYQEGAGTAAELGVAAGSLGLAEETLESAAFALRHADSAGVRGMAHANAAYAQALRGGPAAGLRRLAHLPSAAGSVPVEETDGLVHRGTLRMLAGDLTGALADLSVAARRRGPGLSRTNVTSPLMYATWCHFLLGEWSEAARSLSVAFDVARAAGRPVDFFSLHCLSALLGSFTGRFEEADEDLHEAAELALAVDWAGPGFHLAGARAIRAFCAGDDGRAAELLGAAYGEAGNEGRARVYGLRQLPLLGVVRARTGDVARAEAVLRELDEAEGHGALTAVSLGWVRGAVAAARGDREAAVAAYEAAVATPAAGGDPLPVRALVRSEWGALLMDAGETDAGRALLIEAQAAFRALGAAPFAERCRARLVGVGPDETAEGRDGALQGLSPRERDIAGLVARGWTNREIAHELFISAKTVEYHLGNVYARLGIEGRRRLRDLVQGASGAADDGGGR
ncbi:LuxR family transcriptional regulator [Streptomyces sp. ODS05-4]|uniref:helix-turn-helix transcriptional regulator n=1 Tax=Streptomyces sp. ODS05-4 TaxID=2944939 RepID=UPI00272EADA1|nr:AAA family ATPase [Streptomyces sp. ODS05-4]